MQTWIARENIKRFKQALAETYDVAKKSTLRQLIADEEAHLKELELQHRQQR